MKLRIFTFVFLFIFITFILDIESKELSNQNFLTLPGWLIGILEGFTCWTSSGKVVSGLVKCYDWFQFELNKYRDSYDHNSYGECCLYSKLLNCFSKDLTEICGHEVSQEIIEFIDHKHHLLSNCDQNRTVDYNSLKCQIELYFWDGFIFTIMYLVTIGIIATAVLLGVYVLFFRNRRTVVDERTHLIYKFNPIS